MDGFHLNLENLGEQKASWIYMVCLS